MKMNRLRGALVIGLSAGLVFTLVGAAFAAPAVDDKVDLTAYIIPPIAFTVYPSSSIDIGEIGPENTCTTRTVNVTNTGARPLLITCSIPDGSGSLCASDLELNPFSATIKRGECREIDITLTAPQNYVGAGESGTLIFWGVEATR